MKIAITVGINDKDNILNQNIDLRFGRAKAFVIYNLDNDSFEIKDNAQNMEAMQGAGIQAAQNVVNSGVDAIVTGHCGPKAFRVLTTSGVKIYTSDAIPIKEVIEKFKNSDLVEATSADVDGHWI